MQEHVLNDLEVDAMIASYGQVEPYIQNAYDMAKDNKSAFIMIRKNGLGGSDSSIVLGVNPFRDEDNLVKEKAASQPTHEELAIGDKPNVRKGSDLEPLILSKFEEWSSEKVYKPSTMFRFMSPDCLTINFDGVVLRGPVRYPVEAKFVSSFAEKYWDKSKAVDNLASSTMPKLPGGTLQNHIAEAAKAYGVPAYYYTQVQQEMLGLDAPFGYIAVIFDREWEFKVFKIYRDNFVCNMLLSEGPRIWNRITLERAKGIH